ncbi:alanine racemase [Rhabdothermincola salaria]|uniref:alanine racemase n=1 Tax=Rhabdothermincola salaria TaxID=2903142 RepID=UPI001E4940B5|nr:alanine racemase [Rhabdothermincola salaria]
MRATRADVDLGAIAHNVGVLKGLVAPAAVCAVVKADGYGHGAIAVSRAALAAGADWLAVALVEEGVVLRRSEIDAPVLLLSQPRLDDIAAAVRFDLRVCVYTPEAVEAVAEAAKRERRLARVHLKVDTGMNRVGVAPQDALALARRIAGHGSLELEGVFTHLAVADEPGHPFTDTQLDRFDAVVAELDADGLRPTLLHAANSATAIEHPRGRYDLVRAGISVYGIPPAPVLADRVDLRPAMTLRSEVSMVKRVGAGEGISYGLRHVFDRETTVATVPVGYADGVSRRLSALGTDVLVGGRRCPIVGTITMDQLMVDCGDDDVAVGDEVVLIGRQGDECVTAEEWAERLDTIAYEVVCGIGPRVPRRYR